MTLNDFSDQTEIFDPKSWSWPVHLIGAGGINNLVGAVLIKMGVRELHIWDNDTLEERNLPTEVGYSATMCGKPKTTAMADLIGYLMGQSTSLLREEHNRITVYEHPERVTAETKLSGVVISGVDSMASRQAIWQAIRSCYLEVPFYIDGRSSGEEFQIFALSPADFEIVQDYETWLFDDDEGTMAECGARNIGYISALMAGEIGRLITLFHRGIEIREFPITRNFKNLRKEGLSC